MANYLKALGDVLQLLAHIFAELLQCTAAIRAARVLGSMGYGFAPKMLGQRLTPGTRRGRRFGARRIGSRFRRRLRGLQLFQFQFELLQLDDDLLALAPKDRAPQLLDEQLQMFDLLAARVQFIALRGKPLALRGELDMLAMTLNKEYLQRFVVQLIEIGKSADSHALSMPRCAVESRAKSRMNTDDYYVSSKRPSAAQRYAPACANRSLPTTSITGRDSVRLFRCPPSATQNARAPDASRTNKARRHRTTTA
jgi:hypothetical protein